MQILPINNAVSMKSYSTNQRPTKRQVLVAMSSSLIPGTGQAMNGDWGKGALFLSSGLGLGYITHICHKRNLGALSWVPRIGLAILAAYSALDAAFNTEP